MNKRLRKKLWLGEFQSWLFEISLRYDPARVAHGELWDGFIDAIEAGHMLCGGGGEMGHEVFVVSFLSVARERESTRQVLAGRLRELQEQLDFEFEIGPLQVDLSVASERAPSAASRQRQLNRRRGIEEFAWEEAGCESGCSCCSH